jgi:NAD-dependent DNA ligase
MNKKLEAYLEQCMVRYQEGSPLIPDNVYDRLVENTSFESIIGLIEVGEQRYNYVFPMYLL